MSARDWGGTVLLACLIAAGALLRNHTLLLMFLMAAAVVSVFLIAWDIRRPRIPKLGIELIEPGQEGPIEPILVRLRLTNAGPRDVRVHASRLGGEARLLEAGYASPSTSGALGPTASTELLHRAEEPILHTPIPLPTTFNMDLLVETFKPTAWWVFRMTVTSDRREKGHADWRLSTTPPEPFTDDPTNF
jgi:hypothetical protein